MIIFLSELQKEHLTVIHRQTTQVLVDFCKLTVDYLNNGVNSNKYCLAAEKLDMSLNEIQYLVQALAFLLVEACQHNLSESDFKSSLALAGFASEHQDVLLKLYLTKKDGLSNALYLIQQKDPTYQDFMWRFEVQIASRSCNEEIKPMVAMDFVIKTPKSFAQHRPAIRSDTVNKNISPVHINVPIQDAKAASQCQNIINHVLLQSDLPNLLHMTNKLEEALKESKSNHVRKVQRVL